MNNLPLGRLAAEFVVIVVGVLVALGADAWWDGRGERREEYELLLSIETELHGARLRVDEAIEFYLAAEDWGRALTEYSMSNAPEAPAGLLTWMWAILRDINTAHFQTDALDGALSSGRLQLIRSGELRAALAGWPRVVGEYSEQEDFIRDFVLGNDDVLNPLPDYAPLWIDPPPPPGTLNIPIRSASPDAIRFLKSDVGRSLVAQGTRLQFLARRDAVLVRERIDLLLSLIEEALGRSRT